MEQQQKFEDDAGEMEITEDYVVLDDATGGSLDLSNLRKRKIKIISSAKETIENGEFGLVAVVVVGREDSHRVDTSPCSLNSHQPLSQAGGSRTFSRLRHQARTRAKRNDEKV
jgi:hypothetical protein